LCRNGAACPWLRRRCCLFLHEGACDPAPGAQVAALQATIAALRRNIAVLLGRDAPWPSAPPRPRFDDERGFSREVDNDAGSGVPRLGDPGAASPPPADAAWVRPRRPARRLSPRGREAVAVSNGFGALGEDCDELLGPRAPVTAANVELPAGAPPARVPAAVSPRPWRRGRRGEPRAEGRVQSAWAQPPEKWDPLERDRISAGTEEDANVELKHGRIAVIACGGFCIYEGYLPGCRPLRSGFGAIFSRAAQGLAQLAAIAGGGGTAVADGLCRTAGHDADRTMRWDPLNRLPVEAGMRSDTNLGIPHGRVGLLGCCDCMAHEIFRIPGCRPFDGRDGELLFTPGGILLQFVAVGCERDYGSPVHECDTMPMAQAVHQDVTGTELGSCSHERRPRWGEVEWPIPTERSQTVPDASLAPASRQTGRTGDSGGFRPYDVVYTVDPGCTDVGGFVKSGMRYARIRYDVGAPDEAAAAVQNVRRATAAAGQTVRVLLDCVGPRVPHDYLIFAIQHDVDYLVVGARAYGKARVHCEEVRSSGIGMIVAVTDGGAGEDWTSDDPSFDGTLLVPDTTDLNFPQRRLLSLREASPLTASATPSCSAWS